MDDNNTYIEITVTDSCNCNCSYCFEGCHHSSVVSNKEIEQKQLQFIEDYCKSFDKDKHNQFGIGFWGGEPFMNLDFMKELIATTSKYDFVRYHCYSNGTLVEKYKEFLKLPFIESIKNRINIQLSYDGEPHNTLKRGYSKDNVIAVADLLAEANVPFVFKATLAYDMIPHLVDIRSSYLELFDRYPQAYVRYSPTIDSTISDDSMLDIWKDKLIEIAKLEYKFYKQYGFYFWDWFGQNEKSICKVKNVCMLHTDGNIYVCHGVPYVSNEKIKNTLTLGNIYDNTLSEILNNTIQPSGFSDKCLHCSSTYCAICHVQQFTENDTLIDGWINKRSSDANRCRYFQEFGVVSKLLHLANMR